MTLRDRTAPGALSEQVPLPALACQTEAELRSVGALPGHAYHEDPAGAARGTAGPARLFGPTAKSRAQAVAHLQAADPGPLGVLHLPDGVCFGHGLVATGEGQLLAGELVTGPEATLHGPQWGSALRQTGDGPFVLDASRTKRRHLDGPAIMGVVPGFRIYGHVLVDWLPRVLMAARHAPEGTPVIIPAGLPGYARQLLAMSGIPGARLIEMDTRTECVSAQVLIVASQVRRASVWHPGALGFLRPLAAQAASADDMPERVWISRQRLDNQRRRLLNRAATEDALRKAGFVAVAPETLDLRDQLALFCNARTVVGEAGSGLHSTVFAPPGQAVGVIQAETLGSLLQVSLCHAAGQPLCMALCESLSFSQFCDYGDYILPPGTCAALLEALSDQAARAET